MEVFEDGEIVGHFEIDTYCTRCKKTTKQNLINHFESECSICGKKKKQYASGIYNYHFGNAGNPNYGDATELICADLPEFDIFTFGWPCQDNSIAGKRKGQTTNSRSGLLYTAAKIIQTKKPKYFLAENVKGLVSVNKGIDFIETFRILSCFSNDLPQYDIQMQLFNTRWLLPQNRERLFFIGTLRGEARPEVFPITQGDFVYEQKSERLDAENIITGTINTKNNSPNWSYDGGTTLIMSYTRDKNGETVNNPLNKIANTIKQRSGNQEQYVVEAISAHPRSGKGGGGKGMLKSDNHFFSIDSQNKQLIRLGHVGKDDKEANRIYDSLGISRTIKDGGGGGAKTGLYVVSTTGKGGKLQNRKIYPQIKAKDRADIRIINNDFSIRRLTPFECCKLQGFNNIYETDNDKCWTKYAYDNKGEKIIVPETHQYKSVGNAVTVDVVKLILNKLKQCIVNR